MHEESDQDQDFKDQDFVEPESQCHRPIETPMTFQQGQVVTQAAHEPQLQAPPAQAAQYRPSLGRCSSSRFGNFMAVESSSEEDFIGVQQ